MYLPALRSTMMWKASCFKMLVMSCHQASLMLLLLTKWRQPMRFVTFTLLGMYAELLSHLSSSQGLCTLSISDNSHPHSRSYSPPKCLRSPLDQPFSNTDRQTVHAPVDQSRCFPITDLFITLVPPPGEVSPVTPPICCRWRPLAFAIRWM